MDVETETTSPAFKEFLNFKNKLFLWLFSINFQKNHLASIIVMHLTDLQKYTNIKPLI